MATKTFPTDTPLKAIPDLADFTLISDSLNGQVSKRTTIQAVVDLVEDTVNIESKADKVNVLELDNSTVYSPTSLYHPTTKFYTDTLLSAKADKVNVLELDNITVYSPLFPYNPATKLYVDNTISTLSDSVTGNTSDLSLHEADVSNPHTVTLTQASAGGGNGAVLSDVELQDYSETLTTTSSLSGVLTLDYSSANIFSTTLTENITAMNITNLPASGKAASMTLQVIQDPATPRTVAWGSILWDSGSAPTVTATVDAVDFFTLTSFDGGTTWFGFTAGQAMA